jgi:RNA polymerase sigma factor (sigma-70 family)
LVRRYRQTAEGLEVALGREPTLPEVAERMGEPPNRLAAALARAEAATAVADGETVLASLASGATTPLEEASLSERQEQVRALLAVLTPGQRVAVTRTLLEDRTLDEVATELGVSVARAGQLRLAALKKLRGQPEVLRLWNELNAIG